MAVVRSETRDGVCTVTLCDAEHRNALGRQLIAEMVQAFEKASGRKVPYQIVDRRPGDVAACYADPAVAQGDLGWKAERGVDQMCVDTWRWQSNSPA